MNEIITWLSSHWVEIAAIIVIVERLITAISELTPWKWDDNLARVLSRIIKSIITPLLPTKKT